MPRRRDIATGQEGFALIEILVVSVLIIVALGASLALVDASGRTSAKGKQRDVGNAIAQELIERATGGRNTLAAVNNGSGTTWTLTNDMVDVHSTGGPADRLRAAMDPDNSQSSTAITPASVLSGSAPLVNTAQSWKLTRNGTQYTVSYRACTVSDTYQGVAILGRYDCSYTTPVTPPTTVSIGTNCNLAITSAAQADPSDPGSLTVKLQLLGTLAVDACVGAIVGSQLATGLCTLVGQSTLLNGLSGSLIGSSGTVTQLLGGLLGSNVSATLCPATQVEQGMAGATAGIAASTRVWVSVAWTDKDGGARSITQSTVVRRPELNT